MCHVYNYLIFKYNYVQSHVLSEQPVPISSKKGLTYSPVDYKYGFNVLKKGRNFGKEQ
jgi:hypothetical protein